MAESKPVEATQQTVWTAWLFALSGLIWPVPFLLSWAGFPVERSMFDLRIFFFAPVMSAVVLVWTLRHTELGGIRKLLFVVAAIHLLVPTSLVGFVIFGVLNSMKNG